jgi:DNA-binding NtrC family response regulator
MVPSILAVEPDLVDRFLIERILSDNYPVITLASANEALAFAKYNPFEIAIINTKLINHRDGILLLKQLRKLRPSFISIATTALRDPSYDAMLLHAGFREVAEKPINRERIRKFIEHSLAAPS